MATVTITIATKDQSFPDGTIGGKYVYDIMQSDVSIMKQESDQLFVAFLDVKAGDYAAKAQRMDAGGNLLGDPVSELFTVPVVTVTLAVPDTIGVTLS